MAASRGLEPEALIQQLLGTSTRRLLQGLMDELPTLEPGSKHPVRGSTPSPPDPETQAHPAERVPDARSVRSADESSASLPHGERRRRPRRVALSDAERAELARVLDELPRTGQALRDWRLTRGIDSAALGLACGVSRVAGGLWEKKGDLPAPILLKLARGLASID